MQICSNEITVHGVLTAVLADTTAAAFITDKKQSTTFAYKGCCTCTINTTDVQNVVKLSDLEERGPKLH